MNLYTPAGSLAGTWTAAGWPANLHSCGGIAYAPKVLNHAGAYIIVSHVFNVGFTEPNCVFTYPGGSLVGSWTAPAEGDEGSVYGPAYPAATYGGAYWCDWYTGSVYEAVQFDLGNIGGPGVAPASLGRVKALFK